ncbi:hypothetical protein Clacol_000091 [Clathrus columnatus]|uniref:DUF6533 domain-containing protein n=1 Tax=Clathrus columnatus TaxID=1419009 RepID=A0AAV4ZZS7_9AGAM|nr:hypothetical protein Clacol_000091 [Clathrus columnatus]
MDTEPAAFNSDRMDSNLQDQLSLATLYYQSVNLKKMNNETEISASVYDQLIYSDVVAAQATVASLSLLLYGSLLHLSDEVEYIWKRKFTLPTLLYLLSKYPTTLFLSIQIAQTVLPLLSISACNDLGITIAVLSICSTIGVQAIIDILAFTRDILTIILDLLAFIAVIRQVWGVWKLKRSVGLQSNGSKDIVTLLLQQVLLICDFTIALRERNTKVYTLNQSELSLPAFRFASQTQTQLTHTPAHTHRGSMAGRLRESVIAEMGENNGC